MSDLTISARLVAEVGLATLEREDARTWLLKDPATAGDRRLYCVAQAQNMDERQIPALTGITDPDEARAAIYAELFHV